MDQVTDVEFSMCSVWDTQGLQLQWHDVEDDRVVYWKNAPGFWSDGIVTIDEIFF